MALVLNLILKVLLGGAHVADESFLLVLKVLPNLVVCSVVLSKRVWPLIIHSLLFDLLKLHTVVVGIITRECLFRLVIILECIALRIFIASESWTLVNHFELIVFDYLVRGQRVSIQRIPVYGLRGMFNL